MKIKVFAILKEFYEEDFTVENFSSIEQLKFFLIEQNPQASDILNKSRFAINNKFVTSDTPINYGDTIYIMPHSSGG